MRTCNCEDYPCCGHAESPLETELSEESRREQFDAEFESRGWPGDGSGEDDLADYNAREADDYADEGREDEYLDASYEDRTEIDFDCGE